MWPLGVVIAPPCLDDDLGLGEAVEDLTVEQFIVSATNNPPFLL